MTRQRYTAVGQLLLLALFLVPALWAYFVWHWPAARVVLLVVFAFFLFVVSLFMLGSLLDEIARRRRTKVMIEAGRRLNLTCYPGLFHRDMLPDEAWDSELLQSTDNDVRNLLHGTTQNADIKIFDAYVNIAVNSRNPWKTHNRHRVSVQRLQQTVACVTSRAFQLPRFSLLHATGEDDASGLSEKVVPLGVTALLRGEGVESRVELQASPAFSSRYDLRSNEPQATRMIFDTRVVSLFESEPNLAACGQQHVFLVFRENQLVDADDAKKLLETALRLAKLFSSGYHHAT